MISKKTIFYDNSDRSSLSSDRLTLFPQIFMIIIRLGLLFARHIIVLMVQDGSKTLQAINH